jgi:hypothetical protein
MADVDVVDCIRKIAYKSNKSLGRQYGWIVDPDNRVVKEISHKLKALGLSEPRDYFFIEYPSFEGKMQSIFVRTGLTTYKRVNNCDSPMLKRCPSVTLDNIHCHGKRGSKTDMCIDIDKQKLVGDNFHPDSIETFTAVLA